MLLAVTLAAIFYGSTFALVLAWTGWSISKHGWCRRSLRRFSYLLFLLLLAVRLAWCGVLYAHLLVRPSAQMHALLTFMQAGDQTSVGALQGQPLRGIG